jgi:hypothetical protein
MIDQFMLAHILGLGAASGLSLPETPSNKGNTPFKNINRMPHDGNRACERRVRQRTRQMAKRALREDSRLQVVR